MSVFNLQNEVREWARTNAPTSTAITCLKHIREEVKELADEIEVGDRNIANVEAADIVILLAHLACVMDFDLGAAVEQKWKTVKQRRYERGEDGVYRHVPDGTR